MSSHKERDTEKETLVLSFRNLSTGALNLVQWIVYCSIGNLSTDVSCDGIIQVKYDNYRTFYVCSSCRNSSFRLWLRALKSLGLWSLLNIEHDSLHSLDMWHISRQPTVKWLRTMIRKVQSRSRQQSVLMHFMLLLATTLTFPHLSKVAISYSFRSAVINLYSRNWPQ